MNGAHACDPVSRTCPLVVDLDGTLLAADTLHEGLLCMLRQRPLDALASPMQLLRGGRAGLKRHVSSHIDLEIDSLPWREDVLAFLRGERESGRRIVLATAADQRIADDVARHLGIFDEVIASGAGVNLKGARKLEAIRSVVGADFDYMGDSRADLAVWEGASGAILVGNGVALRSRLPPNVPVVAEFGRRVKSAASTWARGLRLHQWLKNLLIGVPLLTGDAGWGAQPLLQVMGAFMAFSLLASGTYIVNDLLDLSSDRQHARKRFRPIASGAISIPASLAAAAICIAGAFLIAGMLPVAFLLTLLSYWVLTTAYSTVLKRYVLLDVLMLAVLYTVRIIAGAAVLSVDLSPWLLVFSAMVFLSLALLKRCAELRSLEQQGRLQAKGRDYQIQDFPVLVALGSASAIAAVVVFCLFINQVGTTMRYPNHELLWLAAFGLTYWLMRLWVKTTRGEMHDDPLVYTISNPGCRITLGLIVVATMLARFGHGWSS